jgi:hypothetical protein
LADSVKEDVKKEDAKNLEGKLHRDMLQRRQGWRILDHMIAFGWSRAYHWSSRSPNSALRISWVVLLEKAELWFQRKGKDVSALRISWVVLLERAELWFQRKGKDVITELHFFHSINTLRARCLQREGKGTSILMPAHAMLTWRVWGV